VTTQGTEEGDPVDVVESALATALERAAAAGQWGTVEVLARELAARRASREARAPGRVIPIDRHRRS
jgi:hypothetical protein